MDRPRILLDTNVLIPALLSRNGPLSWYRIAWKSEFILPLTSRTATAELLRALTYTKFGLADSDRQQALEDYLPWCEVVTVPEGIEVPECRDPKDRPFLELAASARAEALVTGDKDLLVLSDDFEIPILTPAAFKKQFEV